MFDNDQMTQSAELRELRDTLNAVPVPERPPLESITSRGRAHTGGTGTPESRGSLSRGPPPAQR